MSRPKFEPRLCNNALAALNTAFIPLIECSADFPLELFEAAVTQLVHHPEYNSTLILRSDVISEDDLTPGSSTPGEVPSIDGFKAIRCIRRKLLARRPGRDSDLEQYCTFYTDESDANTLILTPLIQKDFSLPYYHPSVFHLALRYLASDSSLRVEVVPLPGTPTDPGSRLYRTSLALLDALHRYGWGAIVNYKKRVNHDCLVPRDAYQDLYLVMRERHKHLINTWQEVTDPLKHVFEDIGIATFLMLLWKDTFGYESLSSDNVGNNEPWKSWARPPGGFLDLGCGNGLLTHILVSEGYHGHGFDVRARTSWSSYPDATQACLHVHAFDPTTVETHTPFSLSSSAFIIGNHADELSPWVPVLSTVMSASGFLNIPCCAWAFDERWARGVPPYPTANDHDIADESLPETFLSQLNLGDTGSYASSYSQYRIWLASLTLHCGWEVETETLRIPSTRNWSIVGRKRRRPPQSSAEMDDGTAGHANAQSIINTVKGRGLFKPRKPEGKTAEH